MTPNSRPSVLVVEDEGIVAKDIANSLKELGYAVVGIAARGQEAVEKARAEAPDVVLMDIVLKGTMTGITAAEAITAETESLIIYLTAYADDETLRRVKTTHPYGYIVKPFEARELNAVIQTALHRQSLEDELRRSRGGLARALEVMDVGVITVDDEYRIRYINPAARMHLSAWKTLRRGNQLARLADIPLSRLVAPDLSPTGRHEVTLDGPPRRVLGVSGHRLTEAPDEGGLVLVLHEETARRAHEEGLLQAKQEAEKMAQMKDALLSKLSHEIRTPLVGVIGFADALKNIVDAEHQDLVRRIDEGGQRLLDTLSSILELSMLEGDSLTLAAKPVPVAAVLSDSIDLLRPLAEQKDLELTVQLPPPSLHVVLDRTCLERIATNLLSNAIKFTPEGRVTVTARHDAGVLTVTVEDTGVGIEEDFMPHLFEEFRQQSEGLEREFEGVGLGLSITKRLVDLMDGDIEVWSEKGTGSRFTVRVPAPRASA